MDKLSSLGLNAIIYSVSVIFLRISSFAVVALYTNYLSVEEFGILSSLLITMEAQLYLIAVGSRDAFMKFFREYQTQDRQSTLFFSSVIIHFFGLGICYLLFRFVLIHLTESLLGSSAERYLLLTCLAAFFLSLFQLSLSIFRAQDRKKAFTIINIISTLLLISCYLIFLKIFPDRISGVLYANILIYGIFFLLITAMSMGRQLKIAFSLACINKQLRFGFPVLLLSFGAWMEFFVSQYIGLLKGAKELGIFSLAMKISKINYMVLVQPFMLSVEPFTYQNADDVDFKQKIGRIVNYYLFVFIGITIAIAFVAPFLISLMAPKDYAEANRWILPLLLTSGALGLRYFFRILINTRMRPIYNVYINFSTVILLVFAIKPSITQAGIAGGIMILGLFNYIPLVAKAALAKKDLSFKIDLTGILAACFMACALLAFGLFGGSSQKAATHIVSFLVISILFVMISHWVHIIPREFIFRMYQQSSQKFWGIFRP